MKNRSCFVVETPLQILESISILSSFSLDNKEADLYIGTVFRDADIIAKRIEEQQIFSNVFLYDPSLYKDANIVRKLFIMLNPKKRLETVLLKANVNFKYDEIYFSTLLLLGEAIVYLNRDIHVFWIDDGMASYTKGSPDPAKAYHKYGFLFKIFGLNPNRLYPEAIYLNNPSFCDDHPFTIDIREIPKIEKPEWMDTIKYIFDFKDKNIYEHSCAVYLTNPNDGEFNTANHDSIINTERVFVKACELEGLNLIRRLHPREIGMNLMPSQTKLVVDDIYNMWELICRFHLENDNILISWFSTAQFTPKMLFDKEPWVIFLYNIYREGISNRLYQEMNKLSQLLREKYTDKFKVLAPVSLENLEETIYSIASHDKKASIRH